MAIRYGDKTMSLSVRDLVASGPRSGHLTLDTLQGSASRMAAGQRAHVEWQERQKAVDTSYQAEVAVRQVLSLEGWTVTLSGRLDGLTHELGRAVVEEIKSTALPEARLRRTTLATWDSYVAQLETYLWMLKRDGFEDPTGRLVLVGLLDGSRHILTVKPEFEDISHHVTQKLTRLIRAREAWLTWLETRKTWVVPLPFEAWRAGQAALSEAAVAALAEGKALLAEAPTGLGKTAAVLHGALTHALAQGQQVFWATSRHTQRVGVLRTLQRFADRGLPLTRVALQGREALCVMPTVACRHDVCAYARDYHDKVVEGALVDRALEGGVLDPDRARAVGLAHEVCPFELMRDALERADVVVGDVNHALSPGARLSRWFGEEAEPNKVVVVDEAHQLPDRARGWRSPRVSVAAARAAAASLPQDTQWRPFLDLCRAVSDEIITETKRAVPPYDKGQARARPRPRVWADLAERFEVLGWDYALLRSEQGPATEHGADPWVSVGRAVQRMAAELDSRDDTMVALVNLRPGEEALSLVCLDAAPVLQQGMGRLVGRVAISATLSPSEQWSRHLGFEQPAHLQLGSPFPKENLKVVLATRYSTLYRDREDHLPRIAKLVADVVARSTGNVAVYLSSFDVLDHVARDLEPLLSVELMCQPRRQSTEARMAWLERLSVEPRVVLLCVLGGVFAEGIDLPPGALSVVMVVGPGLPPVGLERQLLRDYHGERGEDAFDVVSLVPGLTRVVQAAGRLVRRPEDRGVVMLVGRRFGWKKVQRLFPAWWHPVEPLDPIHELATFFAPAPEDAAHD
ncbi:MAG: helicase C-terminal domain-containing protein [Myxococcota bacterium]